MSHFGPEKIPGFVLFANARPFGCPACGVAVLFESCTVRLRRGLVDDATKKPLTKVRGSCFGGRYRTRTCDLLHVKQMLYQLS